MTVMNNITTSSKYRTNSSSNLHKQINFSPDTDRVLFHKLKLSGDLEADQDSIGSSEEMESPRSVVKVKKWPAKNVDVRLHMQILRIREEDSHLGYDMVVNLSSKDKFVAGHDHLAILPASPLGAGGRTQSDIVH